MTQQELTNEARREIFKSMPKNLSDEDEYQALLSENLREELHETIVTTIGRPIHEYKNEIFNILADNPEPPNCYRWSFSPNYAAFPREDAIGDWSVDTLRACYVALQNGYLAISVLQQRRRGGGRLIGRGVMEHRVRRDEAFAESDECDESSTDDSEHRPLQRKVPSSSGARPSTISQARSDIIQKTKEVFMEYINQADNMKIAHQLRERTDFIQNFEYPDAKTVTLEKTTGLKDVEFPRILRDNESASLPGWYWKFSSTGDFQMMPVFNSISKWKTFQLEAAIRDIETGTLRLCRKQLGRRTLPQTFQTRDRERPSLQNVSLKEEQPVFVLNRFHPATLEGNEGSVAKDTVHPNFPPDEYPHQTPLQSQTFVDLTEEEDIELIQSVEDTEPMKQEHLDDQDELEEQDSHEVDQVTPEERVQLLPPTPQPEDQNREERLEEEDEHEQNKFMRSVQDQINQRQYLISKLKEAQTTIQFQKAHIKELDKQHEKVVENQAIRVVYGSLCADVAIMNANITRLEKANAEKDGEISRLRVVIERLEGLLGARDGDAIGVTKEMKAPNLQEMDKRTGEAVIGTARTRSTTSSAFLPPRSDVAKLSRCLAVVLPRARQIPVPHVSVKRSAQQAMGYTMRGESNNNRSMGQSISAATVNTTDVNSFSPPRKRRRAAEDGRERR